MTFDTAEPIPPALPACPPASHPAAGQAPVAPAAPPYRLVAIDLDGTLLRSDKRMSLATVRAVRRCVEAGVHVVLATARPPRSVRPIWDALGLKTLSIHYNGALVQDFGRARHVYHQPMDVPLVRKLVRIARRADPHCVVSLEILDRWYTDRHDPNLPTETSLHFDPDVIGPLEAFMTVPVTKLMFLAPRSRLLQVRTVIEKRFTGKVGMAVSDAYLLQLMNVQVNKAIALKQVAMKYGIPRQQVLAIGDAPNDLQMLRWAGMGVAMENAWPHVKKAANAFAPSNDNHGVAHTLEKYILNA